MGLEIDLDHQKQVFGVRRMHLSSFLKLFSIIKI